MDRDTPPNDCDARRALVTGGNGFIGRHLCAELLAQGWELCVLARQESCVAGSSVRGTCITAQADLRDASALSRTIGEFRPSHVIHLAAVITSGKAAPESDWDLFRANVQGTANLVEACSGIPQPPSMVYISTMSVYDFAHPLYLPIDERHPVSPARTYGLSKSIGEMLCQYYSKATSAALQVVRLPGVYGSGRRGGLIHNLLHAVVTSQPVVVTSPETRWDYLYVKDAARAIRLAAQAAQRGHGTVCNISGGAAVSVNGLVRVITQVIGKSPTIIAKPGAGESDFYFDGESARALWGFVPRSLADSIGDFWADIQAEMVRETKHAADELRDTPRRSRA